MSLTEPSPPDQEVAPLFAALGDPTRLSIVHRLSDGQWWSVSRISAGLSQSRQGVSKHLAILAGAGIVIDERVGREHHFALRPESIGAARDYLEQVGRQWDDALARLRQFVEDDGPGDI